MNSKLLIPQTPELIEFRAVTFYVRQEQKERACGIPRLCNTKVCCSSSINTCTVISLIPPLQTSYIYIHIYQAQSIYITVRVTSHCHTRQNTDPAVTYSGLGCTFVHTALCDLDTGLGHINARQYRNSFKGLNAPIYIEFLIFREGLVYSNIISLE